MMNSTTGELQLTPRQAAAAVRQCLAARQPVILWSEPGAGKSAIVRQVAAELSRDVTDLRGALLDAVDLRGLPAVRDGRTVWTAPEFLPRTGAGVLFLDELNRAVPSVQNALLQLCLDRRIGEYTLPDGWDIVAACNREGDGGGINRINAALSNRFVHVTLAPDLDDWGRWALSADIDPMVIAFLRFRPALLSQFDARAHAYPTPRSWEFVSRLVSQPQPDAEIELALLSGTVGHGAAIEFSAFARLYRSLPSIDAILMDPAGSPVPTDPATLYALTGALAHRATDANFGRVVQYLDRVPLEFGVFGIRDATVKTPTLTSTAEFTAWCITHADSL